MNEEKKEKRRVRTKESRTPQGFINDLFVEDQKVIDAINNLSPQEKQKFMTLLEDILTGSGSLLRQFSHKYSQAAAANLELVHQYYFQHLELAQIALSRGNVNSEAPRQHLNKGLREFRALIQGTEYLLIIPNSIKPAEGMFEPLRDLISKIAPESSTAKKISEYKLKMQKRRR